MDEVDASGPLLCVTVKCGIGFHEIRNISDVYANVIGTVVIDFDGIVQIPSGDGVNGENAVLAKVTSNL